MHEVIERLERLAEPFEEQADEADRLGRLPETTVKQLRETGVIRLLQPREFAGYEAHPADFFKAVFEVGSHSASAGWVCGVVGIHPWQLSATDLPAWKTFACDLLGLQPAEETPDRLLLRMDEKSYRVDIRRGQEDRVSVLGWEVAGARELDELARTLTSHGYAVKTADPAALAERQVSGLVSFDDPEGVSLEIFYGLKKDRDRFVSPTGARFVTGTGGLGHAFQIVRNAEPYRVLYEEIFGFRLSDHIDFGPGITGTFLHCNQRHHSFAYAPIPPAPQGVGHLMFEVDDLDLVGRAWDKVEAGAAPVALTFGKHSNDEMLSFYAVTPSGFQVEYGYGGKTIDDATWTPSRYDVTSYWGHKRTDPNIPEI